MKKFYTIWSNRINWTIRYWTREDAMKEIRILRKDNPGIDFYLMMSVE